MLKRKKEFVAALAVVVIVCVVLALPYAVAEVYELKAKKLVLLVVWLFLAVFSVGLLIFSVVRYRQTSQGLEMLREEIERTKQHKRSKEQ